MDIMELALIYAEAWKKLDASIIEPYLSDDFTYGSMWVFQSLDREGYLEYLKGKFKTIAETAAQPEVSIARSENADLCVFLNQRGNKAYIHLKVKDDKISEAYMMAF